MRSEVIVIECGHTLTMNKLHAILNVCYAITIDSGSAESEVEGSHDWKRLRYNRPIGNRLMTVWRLWGNSYRQRLGPPYLGLGMSGRNERSSDSNAINKIMYIFHYLRPHDPKTIQWLHYDLPVGPRA